MSDKTAADYDNSLTTQLEHIFSVLNHNNRKISFGSGFQPDQDGGVTAEFTGNHRLQGYNGILHGGIISALLDTAMAQCLLHQNIKAVTGELNIRFCKPVPCTAKLQIRAWVEESLPPLYLLRGEIHVDSQRVAKARGKFMRRNLPEK